MAQEGPNHTQTVLGWAAHRPSTELTPYVFKRRENGEEDVTIKVMYCGICHTDLHFLTNDWGNTIYPVVPGHEITGVVTKVGRKVEKLKVGEKVGVGFLSGSCLECDLCKSSMENYCPKIQPTFNGVSWDGTLTYGGFSTLIVSDHRYVVHLPESLPMDAAAPLLCAGVTVFCPMKDNGMIGSPGKRLGVVGLGGLGHLAIKFGKAFGLHVTVISTSPSKEAEAKQRLGADDFILSTDPKQMEGGIRSLDFILDTVSGPHPIAPLLELLKVNGTLVILGAPAKPFDLPAFPLIFGKRSVKGSMTGGIGEMQEMLDICGKHNITCDIELTKPDQINVALKRLSKNDIRYRFVVDIGGHSSRL